MTDDLRTADRLALRELVEAYARCLDHRDYEGAAALFTEDGILNGTHTERHGRAEIGAAFEVLDQYVVTSHFLGQQSLWFDDDGATGETYCLAHHIKVADGGRVNHVLSIRYRDIYRQDDGRWLFAARRLSIDFVEDRLMG